MRVVLATFGTEGDTRPLLAIAHGLISAGHDVLFLGERHGAVTAQAYGVPFQAMPGDMADLGEEFGDHATGLQLLRGLRATAITWSGPWSEAILDAARGADVLVASSLAIVPGVTVAEALGIPSGVAPLQVVMPTRQISSAFVPPPGRR